MEPIAPAPIQEGDPQPPLPETLPETLSLLAQLKQSFSETEGYDLRTALHFTIERVRRHALSLDLNEYFSHRDRMVLEIGCGHGHFLNAYAVANPDIPCVGIDLIHKRIECAENKRARRGLNNLRFIRAEASEFFDALPPAVKIQRYFVLFADPWPKKRHWKNRLLQPEHLSWLAQRALPGADLYFRTDDAGFFAWVQNNIEESADWRLAPEIPWPFEEKTVFQGFAESYQSLCAVRR